MESRVDLPQPDGPEMAMYSPRAIDRLTSDTACVLTSSVSNAFEIPDSWITVLSFTMPSLYSD